MDAARGKAPAHTPALKPTGENPPYGILGGMMETSASCEARSAPSSYPTTEGTTLSEQRLFRSLITVSSTACIRGSYTPASPWRGKIMRMIMTVSIPVEAGNAAVRNGTLGSTIQRILADLKPEAAYFAEVDGMRTGFIFFDMKDSSQLPEIAEPWFLAFNARFSVRPAMNAQDLTAGMPGMTKAVENFGKSTPA